MRKNFVSVCATAQAVENSALFGRRAPVNVVPMKPAWLPTSVSLVYLMTAVSALAQLHQPVPFRRSAEVSRHRADRGLGT